MNTFDFERFRSVIAGLHHALQNTGSTESARAALLLQTHNPAHSYDIAQFMTNLVNELDSFDQAMEASLKLGDDEDESHGY
ncbi:hypothetical protein [Pseudomonas aeruginosa]|uniref:hypothetical protein n=1 Tax=Pseudomonas aeruginosa TaxID=287 RepID=UPI00093CF005|nr:hypothetical protein [Pseudomonas aeruginosa]